MPNRTMRIKGDGKADAFSPPQVVFGQLVVVVGGAGVPHHEHTEAVLSIRLFDYGEQLEDVVNGVFEGAGHDHGEKRGATVFGDGGRGGGIEVGREGYDIGPEGQNVGGHLLDFG